MKGRVFLVVGPSGAGKDTLLAGAAAADPRLHWARRVITRDSVAGGEPFEGVSEAAFKSRLKANEFALHWQAHGLCYGVPVAEFKPLEDGRDVLINGSRAALSATLAAFPGLRVIQISAPMWILADRLSLRGRESHADIIARLQRATYALPEGVAAIEICNDATLEDGVAKLLHALRA